MIERIARDTAFVGGLTALIAALWFRNLSAPAGVIGGALLIGLSYWAVRGTVDALVGLRSTGKT